MEWKPKVPIEALFQSSTRLESLYDFREQLKAVMDDAQYAYQLPKARQIQMQVFITSDLPLARVISFGCLKICPRTPTAMRSNFQVYHHVGMVLSRS